MNQTNVSQASKRMAHQPHDTIDIVVLDAPTKLLCEHNDYCGYRRRDYTCLQRDMANCHPQIVKFYDRYKPE